MNLQINQQPFSVSSEAAPPEMPLLWVLRDVLNLTGTKYGCGVGACGACTVHVAGQAVRACVTPVSAVADRDIRTIEGLAGADGRLHPVQQAWVDHQVPQCGYCQSGVVMAVAALLAQTPKPSDAQMDAAINNICRCGTTPRMRAAIRAASESLISQPDKLGLRPPRS